MWPQEGLRLRVRDFRLVSSLEPEDKTAHDAPLDGPAVGEQSTTIDNESHARRTPLSKKSTRVAAHRSKQERTGEGERQREKGRGGGGGKKLARTCEGSVSGGSMRIEGSHSPGGSTVTALVNSSMPIRRSSRLRARYAMSWKICAKQHS